MSTQLIEEFNIWQPDYANATVYIYVGDTSTLANVYTNQALSVAAANPQTLASMTDTQGQNYGKFNVPLYTAQSYRLVIAETGDETGVNATSLTALDNEDASLANVRMVGASQGIALRDALGYVVFAKLWGEIAVGATGSAATNTATINTAIGQVPSGGTVILPDGLINVNQLDIPAGVVIKGQGKGATTLQSVIGDKSFSLIGDGAGFQDITLDGNNLTADSIGVYALNRDNTFMENVEIKRFQTNLYCRGGLGARWRNLDVRNGVTNAKLHGDTDAGDTGDGGVFETNTWDGGIVGESTTIGLDLKYVDAACKNFALYGVDFKDNVAVATNIIGAQFGKFRNCNWGGNDTNVNIADDVTVLPPATSTDNKTVAIRFEGGVMGAGKFTVTGLAQDIMLDQVDVRGVEFELNTPISNAVVLRDCTEDSAVTVTGEGTKILRVSTTNEGATTGLTTGNTATKAWAYELHPGEVVYFEAKVVGRGRNVAQRAVYHVSCGAYRAGSALAYDTQTANFTVGDILTGASSGATARIQADADSGATGALTLIDISGAFIDNEIITGSGGGSATANGTLTPAAASLDSVGMVALRTAYETNANWAVSFVANANEVELRVTGDTNQTVEWTVDMKIITS